MKRGYMNWDKELLPVETLKKRRESITSLIRRNNMDAALIYGDVINADELIEATNYGPYWCNTVAILTASGEYCLVTGHNARVNPWLSEMTGLPEEKLFPAGMKVPAKTAEVLKSLLPEGSSIGIIGKYTLANLESAVKKAGFLTSFICSETDEMLALRDDAYRNTVIKGHEIMELAINTAVKDSLGKTIKQICADIEYAVRKAGAMDVYLFAAENGCAFTIPTEVTAERWNIYLNIQYLGEWLTFAFPVIEGRETDYSVIDSIVSKLDQKALPNNVQIHNRVLSDSFSTLNDMADSSLPVGNVFSVCLHGEDGSYFEKMYVKTDNGAKELGKR